MWLDGYSKHCCIHVSTEAFWLYYGVYKYNERKEEIAYLCESALDIHLRVDSVSTHFQMIRQDFMLKKIQKLLKSVLKCLF